MVVMMIILILKSGNGDHHDHYHRDVDYLNKMSNDGDRFCSFVLNLCNKEFHE